MYLLPYGWIDQPSPGLRISTQTDATGGIDTIDDVEYIRKECYKVVLSNGELILFKDSLLQIKEDDEWVTKPLSQLLTPKRIPKDGHYCVCQDKEYINALYEIKPLSYFLPFDTQDLSDLPPYWVGVFIALGCNKRPVSMIADELIERRLIDTNSYRFKVYRDRHHPHTLLFEDVSIFELESELENLGILDVPVSERRIYPSYLFTDFSDRVGILQGLMDTLGWIDKDGYAFIRSPSIRLAEDIYLLLRSLGGHAQYANKSKTPIKKNNHYPVWVSLPPPEQPFSLVHKTELYNSMSQLRFGLDPIYIHSIISMGVKTLPRLHFTSGIRSLYFNELLIPYNR
jgi:hypothetical protein